MRAGIGQWVESAICSDVRTRTEARPAVEALVNANRRALGVLVGVLA
jgi:hypothetical protein